MFYANPLMYANHYMLPATTQYVNMAVPQQQQQQEQVNHQVRVNQIITT